MRFTKTQVALFKGGVSFLHMASDVDRRDKAYFDFVRQLRASGMYFMGGTHADSTFYSGNTSAAFRVCVMQGAASSHVPVMFMDGKKSEFPDQRAYEESRMIPAADADGCGPMVVR